MVQARFDPADYTIGNDESPLSIFQICCLYSNAEIWEYMFGFFFFFSFLEPLEET